MIKYIKVYKNSRILELGATEGLTLGVKTDNNVDILRFKFDEFVDGRAEMLTNIKGSDDKFVPFSLTESEEENCYDLVVTKELLVNNYLTFQLQITCSNNVFWHSLQAELFVNDVLEVGEGEMPESVSNWLINADLIMIGYQEAENKRNRAESERQENEKTRIENETKREKVFDDFKNDISSGEYNGATYIPNVSENGDLSWTNDKNLENPKTVNIKGEKGDKGDCNFATFDIEEGELVMYKTENMLLDFALNDEGELEVLI